MDLGQGEQVAHQALEEASQKDPDYLRQGSILVEKFWGHAENDAFLLGGMDSGKAVCIATDARVPSNIDEKTLWNDTYKMSVLGHELVTLILSGYQLVRHPYDELGMVFLPGREKSLIHKNLGELLDRRKAINEAGFDELIKILKKAEE
jgi:hypothetical protein